MPAPAAAVRQTQASRAAPARAPHRGRPRSGKPPHRASWIRSGHYASRARVKAPGRQPMRFVHRLVVAIYVISIGWFSLLFLPSLLGTAGPPAWSVGPYLQTIVLCQIPATIIAGLIYLAAWVGRGSLRTHRPQA